MQTSLPPAARLEQRPAATEATEPVSWHPAAEAAATVPARAARAATVLQSAAAVVAAEPGRGPTVGREARAAMASAESPFFTNK